MLNQAFSQDRNSAQAVINALCDSSLSGRGYINKGDSLAAEFIAEKYREIGLQELSPNYMHRFNLNINTIPEVTLEIDDNVLRAGYDYLIAPSSPKAEIEGKIFYVSLKILHAPNAASKVKKAVKKGYIPVIATYENKDELAVKSVEEIRECSKAKVIVFLKDHLTWSVARNQTEMAEIWLLDSVFNPYSENIRFRINAQLIENYSSQNVSGYVEGTKYPDSLIILCGHYDHLGKMGDAIFFGANDNASGIAMLLDLAAYFAKNPQEYSIAFVAFGGEEAGLVGSYNFVNSPPEGAEMERIKFVFNMDLMGSGEDGATIVNGSVFQDHFDVFVDINNNNEYLRKIKSRGKAANSDHYFFSELGIPSFFIYLMGEYKHYHIPQDNPENLQLGVHYDASFSLIKDFIIRLNQLN